MTTPTNSKIRGVPLSSGGPSAALVTPLILKRGQCEDRSLTGSCFCWRAKHSQNCQSCNSRIKGTDDLRVEVGDCIRNDGNGWVHVRCERDEQRGVPSIAAGFQPLKRIEGLAPRKLLMDNEQTKADQQQQHQDQQDSDEQKPPASSSGQSTNESSEEQHHQQQQQQAFAPTEEQQSIINHVQSVSPGDVVRVSALAGCGKTTTMALLCNAWKAHRGGKLLYLVFAKDAIAHARSSMKFPKEMSIHTTHSFAKRSYFGPRVHCQFEPVGNYDLDEAVALLDLDAYVRDKFPRLASDVEKVEKRSKQIGRYVIKTVNFFQQSADNEVQVKHVYKKAIQVSERTSKRFKWRSSITASKYVAWAQALFNESKRLCECVRDNDPTTGRTRIPHDAYMKVTQLDGSFSHQYRCIVVDEAQDMTQCQAELFWGQARQAKEDAPVVFIVGDAHQRIYGFRGASDGFENAITNKTFPLTGSFRFGEGIARAANLVLGSQFKIKGLSANQGEVRLSSEFRKGVVICRSNNGMLKFLLHHFLINKDATTKWSFFRKSTQLPRPSQKLLELEMFVNGKQKSFKYDGEKFQTVDDLREYVDDSQDDDLVRHLSLLEELAKHNLSLEDFLKRIKQAHLRDWKRETECADDFDGVILMTCHAAKGLEFDNVLVYDDFPFKHLINPKIVELLRNGNAYPYFQEAKDIIYVAVTRAKKRLYLSQGAETYFNFLNEDTKEPPNKRVKRNLFAKSGKELRQELEEAWEQFQDSADPIGSVDEVPFPPPDFGLDNTMTPSEIKFYLADMLRRYHPDKFLSQFRSRLVDLASDIIDTILSRLHDVTMTAGSYRRSLNRPSDPYADMSF